MNSKVLVTAALLAGAVQALAQRPPVKETGVSPAFPQRSPGDPAMVDRGRALYGVNCNFCHGSDARGGEGGPNLLRSQLVLDDKNGELMAPVIQKGRPALGMPAFSNISAAQSADIAAYVHAFPVLNRDPARFPPPSIVVGDAQQGQAYFQAKCASCHSPSGDLKGLASKITDARALQNTIVMPDSGPKAVINLKPITATVTQAGGKKAEGRLLRIDDFSVTLLDTDGFQRTFRREGETPKVEIHDPLQPHTDLLRAYTDKDIHNLTAYLVTLK